MSYEICKNNHIYSFVIKGFFIIHEHRGGKWRYVHVQLLNNFLNYSILLKQLEDQANLGSDGKDLQYFSVQKCSYSQNMIFFSLPSLSVFTSFFYFLDSRKGMVFLQDRDHLLLCIDTLPDTRGTILGCVLVLPY